MLYCYVLRSQKTGRRYVGSCENLTERIRRHNAGDSIATKHGVPWVLVHSESCASRSEAAQRERYMKPDEVGMNSISYGSAVARRQAVRFKFHQVG
jgi:putative endonuclease